jgi:hypothetical protein
MNCCLSPPNTLPLFLHVKPHFLPKYPDGVAQKASYPATSLPSDSPPIPCDSSKPSIATPTPFHNPRFPAPPKPPAPSTRLNNAPRLGTPRIGKDLHLGQILPAPPPLHPIHPGGRCESDAGGYRDGEVRRRSWGCLPAAPAAFLWFKQVEKREAEGLRARHTTWTSWRHYAFSFSKK